MTGDEDDLEAEADALLTAAGDDPLGDFAFDPDGDAKKLGELPKRRHEMSIEEKQEFDKWRNDKQRLKRKSRSFRACYACVDVGGRPLTACEDAALRLIATALLEARAWIGTTNGWLTVESTLLERLQFRTLAPLAKERLSYVVVTASTDKRRKKR